MKEKQRKAWARIRQQGKWRFVLRYGLLRWALPVALLTGALTLFDPVLRGGRPLSALAEGPPMLSLTSLVVLVLLWVVVGSVVGLIMWNSSEARYHRAVMLDRQEHEDTDPP